MERVVRLAAAYWAGIFALGFVLGTVRTLWLAPRLGDTGAVLCELPVMIAASWFWARRLLTRQPLPGRRAALAMGAIAFALLIACEAQLAVSAFGLTLADWVADLFRLPGALGLAGQITFAAMPALVWQASGRKEGHS